MDTKKLVRDASKVQAALKELPDGCLVCTKTVKIYIPARFSERGLAQTGIETHIVGVYAIVVEDKYFGVSLINAMLRIEPTSSLKIDIDGEEFYEFTFEPGATVFPTLMLVKRDTLVYSIYDEILAKGHVPWYLTYTDLGKLFDTAKLHAGANIGQNHEVTELIVSLIARDAKDRRRYYRSTVKSLDDVLNRPPAIVPLRSVTWAATNTTNKLAGSHFSEGLVSSLVSPAERTERLEALLRQ